MFRYPLPILVFLSLGLQSLNAEEWIQLFDGKSLEGWSIQCKEEDRGKDYWSVVDRVIQCDSIGDKEHDYVWLQFDREFADFELKLRFRGFRESPGNSGVQFRSRYDPSPDAPRGGWLDGPQADIHPPAPFRIGLIYDETRSEKRWIHPSLPDWKIEPEQGPEKYFFKYPDEGDGWNDMVIRCEGTHVQTWVNGIQITDFDGTGILNNQGHADVNAGMNGYIALQLHMHDELKIQFKDLYVKEL